MEDDWIYEDTGDTETISLKDTRANRKSFYISANQESSLLILSKTSAIVFVIWLACLTEFRIRKRKPFRLGEAVRKKWDILPKRLPQQLLKLQELDFLKFRIEKNKAPLIISVKDR